MTDFFWRKLDLTKLIYNIFIVYSSGDLVRYPVRDAGLRLPATLPQYIVWRNHHDKTQNITLLHWQKCKRFASKKVSFIVTFSQLGFVSILLISISCITKTAINCWQEWADFNNRSRPRGGVKYWLTGSTSHPNINLSASLQFTIANGSNNATNQRQRDKLTSPLVSSSVSLEFNWAVKE